MQRKSKSRGPADRLHVVAATEKKRSFQENGSSPIRPNFSPESKPAEREQIANDSRRSLAKQKGGGGRPKLVKMRPRVNFVSV